MSKSWHTLNGVFHTKGRGNFTLKFFEYSNSKEFSIEPDVVEYEMDEMKKVFDLILGIKFMHELGNILDCKNKMITIDEITLPMRNIHSVTKSKVKIALRGKQKQLCTFAPLTFHHIYPSFADD